MPPFVFLSLKNNDNFHSLTLNTGSLKLKLVLNEGARLDEVLTLRMREFALSAFIVPYKRKENKPAVFEAQ